MSLKELFFFRLPQQFQLLILGRFHQLQKFKTSQVKINSNFNTMSYSRVTSFRNFAQRDSFIFNYFDTQLDLSNEINWLRDYKHKKESSKAYYAAIDRQDFEKIGDIKYVFEPSRFNFLPFLALKATINQEDFLPLIGRIIRNWREQNPYLQTVHWTSGIEVGIRSVNLVYSHIVLSSSGIITEEIDRHVKELLQYNYHYLARHLSRYSSANNHLVAELTGLVAISSYLDNKTYSRQRKVWHKKLFNEIMRQVNNDGVNMELSTHYHAEVTDHFFNALQFIIKSGYKVPEIIENRFIKMFDFLDHVEFNGNKTVFGDNDEGALIHPCFNKDFSIYQSLLQSAGFYYKLNFSSKLKTHSDLRNYLLFGDEILNYTLSNSTQNHEDTVFKNSGYSFFYDHDKAVKVSFDFGNIGDDISSAHGHSDIFHFNFEINGEPILVDSGTYQYHKRYKKWRTYFRGASAHNTISINKKDHAFQATRMSWLERPKTTLLDFKLDKYYSSIKSQTDAYKKDYVDFTRTLTLDKSRKTLSIEDDLSLRENEKRSFYIELYLNFGDNIELTKKGNRLFVRTSSNQIVIENLIFNKGNVIKAGNKKPLGWRSNNYNQKIQGQVFLVKYKSKSSQILKTILYY